MSFINCKSLSRPQAFNSLALTHIWSLSYHQVCLIDGHNYQTRKPWLQHFGYAKGMWEAHLTRKSLTKQIWIAIGSKAVFFLAHISPDDHSASEVCKENTSGDIPNITQWYPTWDLGNGWEWIGWTSGKRLLIHFQHFQLIFVNILYVVS